MDDEHVRTTLIGAGLACAWALPALADAALDEPFALSNRQPLVQLFSPPAARGGDVLAAGRTRWRLGYDVANNFARQQRGTEAVVLDVLAPSHRELFVQVPESALLAPIVSAVQEDPGAVPSLSSWAERLGVSTRTITRAFRAETGVGFLGWIATVRAQRAVDLLSRGEAVEEVSAELGYSSPSAFGAAFRRTTGFTPSAFRSR